jgi:hypothetical protein
MRRRAFFASTKLLQRARRGWSYAFLALVVLVSPARATGQTPTFQDISSQVSMTRSGLVLNRTTQTFNCLVQVTNTSTATISGTLVLSVLGIDSTTVSLSNAAGQDASGNPYVNLVVPTGGLAPGQTIANTLLAFSNPGRISFTFATAVLSKVNSTNQGATVQDATGGTISVTDPQNPSSIVTIVIPPGVLGIASDVISVSFSSTPPGSLNANAVAAGAHFVSRVISLTRASGLKFLYPIEVTIPYDLTQVGPNDPIIVLYWDTTQNEYDVVATVSVDRVNGTITFQTVHFSQYEALSAHVSLAPGSLPTNASDLFYDTLFRAASDGFPIGNISTLSGAATKGACFGLTAFAKWYYQTQSSVGRAPAMQNNPVFNHKYLPMDTASVEPAEDDVDRELIYWGFTETNLINIVTTWLNTRSKSDFDTANALFLSLRVLRRPQLIVLARNGSYADPTDLHSVLVYNYNIDVANSVVHFGFYDPNVPGQEQVLDYGINAKSFGLAPYKNAFGTIYSWVYFNALSTFMEPNDFAGALSSANAGWPNRHFNEITIDQSSKLTKYLTLLSPEGPNPVSDPAEYQVMPGSTTIDMAWSCSCPPSLFGSVYAHVFMNGVWVQDEQVTPIAGSSVLGVSTPFAIPLPPLPASASGSEPEIIVIISAPQMNPNPPSPFTLDDYLADGYEGFLRIKLKPPLYVATQMLVVSDADATNYPYGNSPYEDDNDRLLESCYTPANLLSINPNYYPMQSSLIPFSANFPLACIGWEHVVQLGLAPILNPPVLSGGFSASLSGPYGAASATSNLSVQLNPNSISISSNGSALSSDFTLVANIIENVTLTVVVASQARYQVTAQVSPNSTGSCGMITAGMSVRDPNTPGGTLQNNLAYAGSQFPPYANPSVSFEGSLPSSYNVIDIGVSFSCPVGPLGSSRQAPPVQGSVTMTLIP